MGKKRSINSFKEVVEEGLRFLKKSFLTNNTIIRSFCSVRKYKISKVEDFTTLQL
jgi:hypothetical protein